MKFAYGIFLLVCLGAPIEGTKNDYSQGDIEAFRNFVARSVFQVVDNRLRNFHGPIEQNQNARATIIPPIEDPLTADPLNICGLDILIPVLNISVQGDVNVMNPVVTGLSKFSNDLKIDFSNDTLPAVLTIDIDIELPQVTFVSPYMAEIVLTDNGPNPIPMDITGDGDLPCGASDVFLKFHGKGKLPLAIPGFSLDELDVDLGFTNLQFDPTGLTSAGVAANLTSLANLVQGLFDALWIDENKIAVNEIIRCLIDDLVSECTLAAITIGGTACLKEEINMECFPSEESFLQRQYIFQTPVCEWLETAPTEGSEEPTETPPTDPTVTAPTRPTVTTPTGPTVTPPTGSTDTENPVTSPNAASFFPMSPIIITIVTVLSIGNVFA